MREESVFAVRGEAQPSVGADHGRRDDQRRTHVFCCEGEKRCTRHKYSMYSSVSIHCSSNVYLLHISCAQRQRCEEREGGREGGREQATRSSCSGRTEYVLPPLRACLLPKYTRTQADRTGSRAIGLLLCIDIFAPLLPPSSRASLFDRPFNHHRVFFLRLL